MNTNQALLEYGYPRGKKIVSLKAVGAAAKWLRKYKKQQNEKI